MPLGRLFARVLLSRQLLSGQTCVLDMSLSKTSPQPVIVGLTGNIATGKSTVLRYLADKGAHIIDADKLSHKAIEPDGPAYLNVVAAFGKGILNDDGTVNRPALGAVVFADPAALQHLEGMIHPAVFELARTEIVNSRAPLIIYEAIKLLESGNVVSLCDEIWVVTASQEVQLQRLRDDRGMAEVEALKRMAAQSSQEEKVQRAYRVIQNDTTLAELHELLDRIWLDLPDPLPESYASYVNSGDRPLKKFWHEHPGSLKLAGFWPLAWSSFSILAHAMWAFCRGSGRLLLGPLSCWLAFVLGL